MAENLGENAKNMRSRVFKHMLKTRGWKYRAFLRYLRFFKYVSFSPTRGDFLESYYTLMRYLDDIVDGDAPLPLGYLDTVNFLKEKIQFSENPDNPKDEIDFLMLHCFNLAKRFHEDFQMETKDILYSLLFDANRKGKGIIFPEKELMRHFHLMDVRGTIKATLKIFKEDPEKYKLLKPLGIATRYQFDLEDFEADIKAGYVNITKEECLLFGIETADLHNRQSAGIKKWFQYRAEQGLALLEEHHQRLPEGRFSLLTRATFPIVYEFPARKFFKKALREK
ncbi:class 1 isoprenoid biosynthesis enzyme [Lutibacter sp.]|uniref:class 1 isoprenoid biosynthesis enzyme n=1 Tax=Lutibacter sp. TaxID=1925666 RepID=UPI00356AACF6